MAGSALSAGISLGASGTLGRLRRLQVGYESCQGEIWLASFFADAQDRKFCLSVAAFLHPLLHIIRVFPVLTELFPWLPYERPGSGDWLVSILLTHPADSLSSLMTF